MKSIRLTIELVTPAFVGGADQQAEFRPASLKNVWRWWWRALRPSLDDGATAEEGELFGTGGSGSRQGALSLRLARYTPLREWGVHQFPNLSQPLGYLGYGPIQYGAKREGRRRRQVKPFPEFEA